MAPRKPNEYLNFTLEQVNVQSTQPAQAGGGAEINLKHALALLLALLLFFD